jgi:hypothetical protein
VTTEARVQIIKKGGEDIASEIAVPKEYASKASAKYASKIIKEQINLDDITLNAAKELSDAKVEEGRTNDKEIEDDWLNEFESHARLKSSDDMKLIFGKILSGEILNPGTFSIRSVRLISQLDSEAARLFQVLSSCSVSLRIGTHMLDARVISLSGNAASNSLTPYGLLFDNLNILQEHGLIISDYNSYMGYAPCIASGNRVFATVYFNGKHYGLVPTDNEKFDKTLQLYEVALTKAGKELLDIITVEKAVEYEKNLVDFFEKKYLKMVEVNMA